MDWPVIGAIAGVTALAGTVGIGVAVVWQSGVPAAKVEPGTPMLLVERRTVASAPKPLPATKPAQARRDAGASSPLLDPRFVRPLASDSTEQVAVLPDRPRSEPRRNPVVTPHADLQLHVPRPGVVAKPRPKEPSAQEAPRVDRRYAHVLSPPKISQIRAALRLSREQLSSWPPVEAVLRKIGREQTAQIERGGQPDVPSGTAMELYWAAQPLLGSLREDQKEKVRALARSLGYPQLASML